MYLDTDPINHPIERIVVATTNAGKVAEFRDLFVDLPIGFVGVEHIAALDVPNETGATFEENARIKACDYAKQIGEWVIADDSGLEIDVLDGAPGVHSARFGGESTGYPEKMKLVLGRLSAARPDERSARFVCVIALAKPTGEIALTARGECRGTIADGPRGANGFGYDPIFVPENFDRTFGEMTDGEKRALSHRAYAAEELIRKIRDFTGV